MRGLQNDLWSKFPGLTEKYWVGFYSGQFGNSAFKYSDQARVSGAERSHLRANGLLSVKPGGDLTNCDNNNYAVPMIDQAGNSKGSANDIRPGYYASLEFTATKEAKLRLLSYSTGYPLTGDQNYLCEKETDWSCPPGYLMFQEHCYALFTGPVTFAEAERACLIDEGGKLVEIQTKMQQTFLDAWMVGENFNVTETWVGLRRKTHSDTETDYKWRDSDSFSESYDWASLHSETTVAAGAGEDSVAMERNTSTGFLNSWRPKNCKETAAYICQLSQGVSQAVLDTLPPLPQVMMPLDGVTGFSDYNKRGRQIRHSLVAVTNLANPHSGLQGSAQYLGSPDSFIEIQQTDIVLKMGLSVMMWIKVEKMEDGDISYLLDGRAECLTGTESTHSFLMFLEKTTSATPTGTASNSSTTGADFDLSASCNSTGPSVTGSPSGGDLHLYAVLCNGLLANGGSCKKFKSLQSTQIGTGIWTFVAFTYDKINKTGTFFINDVFGYHDIGAGVDKEAEYFTYDTVNWLTTDAVKGPLRLGSRKFQDLQTGSENLIGQMSCLQIYEGRLLPSLVHHHKNCPVSPDYAGRMTLCPLGYTYFRRECFQLSRFEKEYGEAEYDCARQSNSNFTVKLGYTEDNRLLGFMTNYLERAQGKVIRFWFGLDGRSDQDLPEPVVNGTWRNSHGDVISVSDVKWEGGQMDLSSPLLQCAVIQSNTTTLLNIGCFEKLPYLCLTPGLDQGNQDMPCPAGFLPYKGECYGRSVARGVDYDGAEKACAFNGSRVVMVRDRATFHFIRAFAAGKGVGQFYLGLNWTTGDPSNPVIMSDGTPYNKTTMYAFDDQSEKFGKKNCTYIKGGVRYMPRDTKCDALLNVICHWNRPTCPSGYFLYPQESDGRTCYSSTTGQAAAAAASLETNCAATDNFLRRPGLPWNPNIINKVAPLYGEPLVWIEGFSEGDNQWRTWGYRDWDYENRLPQNVSDLSHDRKWYTDKSLIKQTDPEELFFPKRLPQKIKLVQGFCAANSDIKFFLSGVFKSPIGEISPQVIMRMNGSHELFHWDFREGDHKTGALPSYSVWSREKKVNFTASSVSLVNMKPKLDKNTEFNLTVTCVDFNSTNQFRVEMNYWDGSNGLARTSSEWDVDATMGTSLVPDDVTEVEILGGMEVSYAGFTTSSCLALTHTGLVVELKGSECSQPRDGVCEHQSCYSIQGNECLFPFWYKGQSYTRCTSVDVYQPWCATAMDGANNILAWGLCLPDCQYDLAEVSCLAPPPVPRFGRRNDTGHPLFQNYESSWFNISFIDKDDGSPNHTAFNITRDFRAKLYQPWMLYDAGDLVESNLGFIAGNQSDHFNDVYEIKVNGSVENYTCPEGWHFQDSKNITHSVHCLNWTWVPDFNISKPCVPVMCPEAEVPTFKAGTQAGTTNYLELKAADPKSWNSYQKRLTYTCPLGYVIEVPGGNYNEQPDPISKDLQTFEVECAANAAWTPRPLDGGNYMPSCIRKDSVNSSMSVSNILFAAINCTEAPFPVYQNDLGMSNWTGVDGVDPRPYATAIKYFCRRKGWGYPTTGDNETTIYCRWDGTWSNDANIESCISKRV